MGVGMKTPVLLLWALMLLGMASCADNPKDRGPWHEWLHEKGLE
jgi:hypothetical protein